MTSKNIDQLLAASALADSDKMLIAQGNTILRRGTLAQLRTWIEALGDSRYANVAGDDFTGEVTFSGTAHRGLRLLNLTTTQRNALSGWADGHIICNTTEGRLNLRLGGAWHSFARLSGDTMTGGLTTGGVLLVPIGSAAAPTYSFVGDTDTGMYASAENTLAWAVGGVVRAQLVSTAFDIPSGRIQTQVADSALSALFRGVTMGVRILHSSLGSTIEGVDHTGVGSFQPLSLNGSTFNMNSGGTTRMNIAGSGNVAIGIGGTAASTTLQVGGPIRHATYTVATLPAAGTVGAGTRAAVTDANATTFNATVAGGGANFVPVISNGTNWLIG